VGLRGLPESAHTVGSRARARGGARAKGGRKCEQEGEPPLPDPGGGALSQLAERAVECWGRGDVKGAVESALSLLVRFGQGVELGALAREIAYWAARREAGMGRSSLEGAKHLVNSGYVVQYVVREVVRRVAQEREASSMGVYAAMTVAGSGASLATLRQGPVISGRLPEEEELKLKAAILRRKFGLESAEFYLRLGAVLAYTLLEASPETLVALVSRAERELERWLSGAKGT